MKTLLLFITSLLLSITTVSASHEFPKKNVNHSDFEKRYRFAQPIIFIERGVEFFVFPDGSFDFDLLQNNIYNKSNSKRTSINTNYKIREQRVQFTSRRQRSPIIIRDRFGKIVRINNTSIFYDRMGEVTQIGSVDIDYYGRNKMVSKVGGLHVTYNQRGQIRNIHGYVNRWNRELNLQVAMNYDNFYDNHDDDDDDVDNHDYFYNKKHGVFKKVKKNKH